MCCSVTEKCNSKFYYAWKQICYINKQVFDVSMEFPNFRLFTRKSNLSTSRQVINFRIAHKNENAQIRDMKLFLFHNINDS